jgi:hypothetical protein
MTSLLYISNGSNNYYINLSETEEEQEKYYIDINDRGIKLNTDINKAYDDIKYFINEFY